MKNIFFLFLILFFSFLAIHNNGFAQETIKLPSPCLDGTVSLEKTLAERRTVREFSATPLSLDEISQLLWAGQGIIDRENGYRTAPSAGALYPLTIYLIAGNVAGLPQGVYEYKPDGHELVKISEGDMRPELCKGTFVEPWIKNAGATFVLTADYKKSEKKFAKQAIRYVDMEAGGAAQNIYLEAAAINVGIVAIGAFDCEKITKIIGISSSKKEPVYIIPAGKK